MRERFFTLLFFLGLLAAVLPIEAKTPSISNALASAEQDLRYPGLNVDSNQAIRHWMRAYLANGGIPFRSLLARAYAYKPMVQAIFDDAGIPPQFFYLGVIESGYEPRAHSRRGALGIWQFTPGTAAIYGLDRRETHDPCLSTRAAAQHIAHLFDRFHSWPLVIAAYNAGESRMQSAIERTGTDNYWKLARRHALPAQTLQYVPRFLAAVALGEHLERYGVEEIKPAAYRANARCYLD